MRACSVSLWHSYPPKSKSHYKETRSPSFITFFHTLKMYQMAETRFYNINMGTSAISSILLISKWCVVKNSIISVVKYLDKKGNSISFQILSLFLSTNFSVIQCLNHLQILMKKVKNIDLEEGPNVFIEKNKKLNAKYKIFQLLKFIQTKINRN